MSNFKLSREVDNNKIFLINLSALENRIDCEYYKENLDFSNCIKLKEYVKVKGGKRLPKEHIYSNDETEYLYLRVSNFSSDNDEIDFNNLKFINKDTFEILERYEVIENDLIFSIAGTVGKLKLISNIPNNKRIILTENAAKIEIINNEILPKYLEIILKTNFLQKQINLNYIQTTIPKIGLDRIENLYIPKIPSKEIQESTIKIYEIYFEKKQQKEQEAKELLESIDSYLLDELEITLPEVDNSLEKRIFEIKFSEISARFDAPSNQKNEVLISDKYEHIDFNDILYIDPSIQKTSNDTLCSFIPMEKISDEYAQADISLNRYFSESNGYTKFQNNDLLWSKITPCMENGKSAVVDDLENGIGFGSTEYYVFRIKNDTVNISYIHAFFRLKVLRQNAKKYFSGTAGHQRVSKEFFYKLKIPLPSIEKQNDIAEHIQGIRNRAKQLQDEAKLELENAKKEVEKLILGE